LLGGATKILDEFPTVEEEYPGKPDSKRFCENSRLGKGISGKTPVFIRLARFWSVKSRLGSGKGTVTFLQCSRFLSKKNLNIELLTGGGGRKEAHFL
jgi:hypothetical protein